MLADHPSRPGLRRRVLTVAVAVSSVLGVAIMSIPQAMADTPTPTWTELSPLTSPPARWFASMAYDPSTGQLVLFGGSDGSGELADTWTWNGSTWAEQLPSTSPPARQGASMAFDPASGQLVLFGGVDGSGE